MNYAMKFNANLRSLILLNSLPASSKLWRDEEQLLAQKTSREDRLQRQAILDSDLFATNKPQAIKQLLLLSFRNQFYEPF